MSIRKRLGKAWGNLQIQTIISTLVEQLLLKQEQASSTSTRKHYLATLNTILKWAQKYQLLSILPTRNIRRTRIVEHVPDALNSEEIDRLLEKLRPEEE